MIFDRSWYNRAGVEYVLGFCTKEQHRRFLEICPAWEKQIVDSGILLLKYWLEVGPSEQKPITRSTPARLYQLRSRITTSPAAGRWRV